MPPTSGGSTSGSVVSVRSTAATPLVLRAMTIASGTPSTTHTLVAIAAVTSERVSACSAAGEATAAGTCVQSSRTSSATSGSASTATPSAAGTYSHGGKRATARAPVAARLARDGDLARGGRHGEPKPNDASTAWPSSEVTNSTKALAASGFAASVSAVIG